MRLPSAREGGLLPLAGPAVKIAADGRLTGPGLVGVVFPKRQAIGVRIAGREPRRVLGWEIR